MSVEGLCDGGFGLRQHAPYDMSDAGESVSRLHQVRRSSRVIEDGQDRHCAYDAFLVTEAGLRKRVEDKEFGCAHSLTGLGGVGCWRDSAWGGVGVGGGITRRCARVGKPGAGCNTMSERESGKMGTPGAWSWEQAKEYEREFELMEREVFVVGWCS